MIVETWQKFKKFPGGKWIFSRILGRMIPYTGSIGACVEECENGRAQVKLYDRKAVRNHLQSIHAVALVNLGELCTGLALHSKLGANQRAILKGLSIEYLKKARGDLLAEAVFAGETVLAGDQDIEVLAHIKNANQDEVATLKALWRVGSTKKE